MKENSQPKKYKCQQTGEKVFRFTSDQCNVKEKDIAHFASWLRTFLHDNEVLLKAQGTDLTQKGVQWFSFSWD